MLRSWFHKRFTLLTQSSTMKFITKIVLIAGLCYVAELLFPWWSIAICAFVVNLLLPTRGFNAFLSGFLGVGLLWLSFSWLIDWNTESLLTDKVADILMLNNALALVAASGLVGGLVGGLAALSGSLLRNLRQSEEPQSGYYR